MIFMLLTVAAALSQVRTKTLATPPSNLSES